jgi:hypothetical protein
MRFYAKKAGFVSMLLRPGGIMTFKKYVVHEEQFKGHF